MLERLCLGDGGLALFFLACGLQRQPQRVPVLLEADFVVLVLGLAFFFQVAGPESREDRRIMRRSRRPSQPERG